MILLIDNYDSFSYNLVQVIGEIFKEHGNEEEIRVVRNDALTVEEVIKLAPTHVILSPGPGRPENAGICEQLVKEATGKLKILGVCLGHQAICEAYGGTVTYAKKLMHGKQSKVRLKHPCDLWKGLQEESIVGRYHSLIVSNENLPEELEVIAMDDAGEIMAVKHKDNEIYGLQFHPESVLTLQGKQMLENYFNV